MHRLESEPGKQVWLGIERWDDVIDGTQTVRPTFVRVGTSDGEGWEWTLPEARQRLAEWLAQVDEAIVADLADHADDARRRGARA